MYNLESNYIFLYKQQQQQEQKKKWSKKTKKNSLQVLQTSDEMVFQIHRIFLR